MFKAWAQKCQGPNSPWHWKWEEPIVFVDNLNKNNQVNIVIIIVMWTRARDCKEPIVLSWWIHGEVIMNIINKSFHLGLIGDHLRVSKYQDITFDDFLCFIHNDRLFSSLLMTFFFDFFIKSHVEVMMNWWWIWFCTGFFVISHSLVLFFSHSLCYIVSHTTFFSCFFLFPSHKISSLFLPPCSVCFSVPHICSSLDYCSLAHSLQCSAVNDSPFHNTCQKQLLSTWGSICIFHDSSELLSRTVY